MIYLDNASTTKSFDEVGELIKEVQTEDYFNPSAQYKHALNLSKRLQKAREAVANKLNVSSQEIYFTSGATESNNWAIFNGIKNKKGNIVVSCGEHPSVYECCTVQKNNGYEVRFSPLNSDGSINIDKFEKNIDQNTTFISVIHTSNEVGITNDISRLSCIAKSKNNNVIFHSDGVQAFCKNKGNIDFSIIDLYSISSHKIGGCKGVGALYINKKLKLRPLIFGGGQENMLRSGTENTAGILAFDRAIELYEKRYNHKLIQKLHIAFLTQISNGLSGFKVNTTDSTSNIISISFFDIKGEILQRLLSDEDILIGLGSACSNRKKGNRILSNMGLSENEVLGNIRVSFGVENTLEEVIYASNKIIEKVNAIRSRQIG